MLRRCFLRSMAAAPAAGLIQVPLPGAAPDAAVARFSPSEGVNAPVGTGLGIHPGRVTWLRDPAITSWDGASGHWWDDGFTNQRAVHQMTSRLVESLAGRKNEKQAWDSLFRNFNETRGFGRAGYKPGEKIAIKVNCNQDRSAEWGSGSVLPGGRRRGPQNGLPSPHAVAAVVTSLIEQGGVRGEDVLVYDATGIRNVGDPITTRIKANSSAQFQAVRYLAGTSHGLSGRLPPAPDMANPIRFAGPGLPAGYLPVQVTEAKYMINMALLRPHGMAGVTLIGKNHFGSVYFPDNGGWLPQVLHKHVLRNLPMGSYNALVDLMGHRHLGGKTMLYILDGLYTAEHNEGNVFRWESFGNQWASMMLMSQDPVAIDSVALDFLRNEPRAVEVRGNADNYLHEAAMAAKPGSGVVYNPDGSGPLASLGAHEHWNNATERKYSRNLGRKTGIELMAAG
jgi:hypothetical protein